MQLFERHERGLDPAQQIRAETLEMSPDEPANFA
jgi:hypothetical protein